MTSPDKAAEIPEMHNDLVKYFGEQEKQFREAANKLRDRSDTAAKGLILLGTTTLTAAGIAKFGDIFPLSNSYANFLAVPVIAGSFGVIVYVLGFFTIALWRVNSTVVMSSRVEDMANELHTDRERKLVNRIYDEVKNAHDAATFEEYGKRAHRPQNGSNASSTGVVESPETIVAEVGAAQARAAHAVIRERANVAITSNQARIGYIALAIAVLAFAGASDWLSSERTDEVAVAKACADAREAGASVSSINICDDYPDDSVGSGAKTSPASLVAAQVAPLQKQLETCRAAEGASSQPGANQCAALETALSGLLHSLQPAPRP